MQHGFRHSLTTRQHALGDSHMTRQTRHSFAIFALTLMLTFTTLLQPWQVAAAVSPGHVHVRVELLRVYSANTEDTTGRDTFYVAGGARVGDETQGIHTQPVWINDRETKAFYPDSHVMFD